MVRKATEEDAQIVYRMALEFVKASGYEKYSNETKVWRIVEDFLNPLDLNKVVFLYEDYGMILGQSAPFLLGADHMASELAWWVDPDKRKSRVGQQLMDAFEEWAIDHGCKTISMASLDDDLGKYYEKRGYTLYERAYMKEL